MTGFLDHLLREWPTKQFAAIKRAFFFDKLGEDEELKQEFYQPLANMGASVYRGIYQAIKPTPVRPCLLIQIEDWKTDVQL